jgi:predicted alpha/beta-hydrolase family hydrolase
VTDPERTETTMSEQTPTIVLVHGAFAESASWSAVVEQLQSRGHQVVAAANPLRNSPPTCPRRRPP